MKDELITFKTTVLAKEKGFNLNTLSFYLIKYESLLNNEVGNLGAYNSCSFYPEFGYEKSDVLSAPTQSLLQRWLREVHSINIDVDTYFNENQEILYRNSVFKTWEELIDMEMKHLDDKRKEYKSYEEALEDGLKEGLDLIKL